MGDVIKFRRPMPPERREIMKRFHLSRFIERPDFHYRRMMLAAMRDCWRNNVRPGHPMWEVIAS